VNREAEREAFAKACSYLNYHAAAKWSAHVAAASIGVLYVLLLVVLALFVDLLVSRGQFPNYHALTPAEQNRFLNEWSSLSAEEKSDRLKDVGYEADKVEELTRLEVDRSLQRPQLDAMWRAQVGKILKDRIHRGVKERVSLEQTDFDEQDNGLLSLVVRADARGSYLTPVVAWLARWNTWAWNRPGEAPLVPPYLTGLLILAVVLALLGALAAWLMREMAARACIEAATRLRRAVYLHTFRLGTLAFRALGPTEAVTVFTRHVEAVNDALYARLTVFFREASKFGLLVLFALLINFWLALAFLTVAVLIWLIGGQVVSYFNRQGRQATNQAGERLTIMRESLMMMRLVKCYLMEGFNRSRVERQLARYAEVQLVRYRGEAISSPVLIFLGLLCSLLLMYAAGLSVLTGKLGLAGLIAMVTALVSLYRPLENWLESRRLLRRGRDSAGQVFTFLDRRGDVGQAVGAEFLHPLKKQIEFDNVSLREPGSSRMLLEEVSLTIPANQRIGLIGADDLEKHALVYLIPRLLDPTTGEIRIDQHNLRWVTLDSLRNQIAVVLQHNLTFHDTVANNIGCGEEAFTLPQIIEAAKVAHAHNFIQKLPQGYETPIGELGHGLTTSQQYRIALARAILRDPALLIIEEPETAQDEDTKALLDDTMTRILPGRTTIFLPHRISTIRSCDKLFLFHRGKVVATGQHRDLLSSNTLYRHLHYLEFNEVEDLI